MSREQAKCKTCRYFDAVDDRMGMCKIDSPAINSEGYGHWPLIHNYEWCGRHRPFFKVVNTPMGVMMKPVDKDEEELEKREASSRGHKKSCPARWGSRCDCEKL